jgi:hypothetical protein
MRLVSTNVRRFIGRLRVGAARAAAENQSTQGAHESLTRIGVEHRQGGGENVSGGGVGCHDSHRRCFNKAEPGPGIDDVGIAHAFELHPSVPIARGGDPRTGEQKHVAPRDNDPPTLGPGWRRAECEVPAGVDEGRRKALLDQGGEGGIRGEALGNAAQVEGHSLPLQPCRATVGVEHQIPVTHGRPSPFQASRIR